MQAWQMRLIKEDKRPYGVDLIHLIYMLFAFFGSMLLFVYLIVILTDLNEDELRSWFFSAFMISCIWVIIYGLYKRKSWLVIFILAFSAFSFIHSCFDVFGVGSISGLDILKKIISLLSAIFYGFQLIIFSRKETKEYYGFSGINLIA
jgi:ABC-type multidrug transport system permease subunit